MLIKPSAMIRNNYNEISEICKKTGEPVFLTKNGEGDLVVLSIEAYEKREKMLELREALLESEEDIKKGRVYSVEEIEKIMDATIEGVAEESEKYEV